MKRGRFSEEQIVGILKEHEGAERSRSWLGSTVSARRPLRLESKYSGVGEAQPPSETAGGRSQSGQRGVEGDRANKGRSLPA
jgi:hypothetical protein